ncbi:Hypothetical protein LUCI_0121 [Lucifera butyrica]|uniref:Transcription regulator hth crp n=1 Tax=Lucifera butyrica TaxID=1351585 RepID=A0A498R183_9FIRM|nr:Crp/Fnr family transcriptional regulator [Lucifera butyrica]VBB04915.1 Hypothetical protein LUCI_0121 [Lucifera butyrica]
MNIHNIIQIMEREPEIYRMLKGCPYHLLQQWEIHSYTKGSMIGCQGEKQEYFYIIISGKVDIYIIAPNGKCYSQAIYEKGDYIGELELFDKLPYICSAKAIDDVLTFRIKRQYFLEWLEQDHNINNHILQTLCRKFYKLSLKAGEDILYPLRWRVCKYLLQIREEGKRTEQGIEVKVNKEKLSEKLAVTERSINRILSSLRESGILDIRNNCILIKSVEKLEEDLKNSCYD